MKKTNHNPSPQDLDLFRQSVGDIKPIEQDKIAHQPQRKQKKTQFWQSRYKQAQASFFFSDNYEPQLTSMNPVAYVRADANRYLAKQLRRGDYYPDIILDLHGYKKEDAKRDLADLIVTSIKRHYHCVCVMHGIGQKILKRKLPHWLVQHPAILAFHQAPLEWGGAGALLVLIETDEREEYQR